MAPNPDRDPWLLDRLGLELDSVDAVVLAVELRVRLAPERLHDSQELVGHRAALVVVQSQDLELFLQPAHSHAANDAAAGQNIQRREHLGLDYRVAVGQDDHRAA